MIDAREGRAMDRMTVMETLVSVIEAGSFSGGARRLNIGQFVEATLDIAPDPMLVARDD